MKMIHFPSVSYSLRCYLWKHCLDNCQQNHKLSQFSSVAQSCPTLCNPMNCSMPGLPVHHQLPEFTQTHVHWVGDASSHLILCHPLLLLPPIPPGIRVFSNESTDRMRWPKYWSFSFSIIPSKEHPGLISFRMDWLDLLAVQGTLKSLLQHHSSNCICYAMLCYASVVSDSVWPHRRQPTRLPRPWDSPGKNTGVGCHFLIQCMKVKSESEVSQSCPTLSDPMDCRLPGSSVHGIFQARVLEWGAIAFSVNLSRAQEKRMSWFILLKIPREVTYLLLHEFSIFKN